MHMKKSLLAAALTLAVAASAVPAAGIQAGSAFCGGLLPPTYK